MSNTVDGLSIARFRVPDMCCATEEQLIRNRLRSVRGIETMEFDLFQQLLTVGHRLSNPTAIREAIGSVGLTAESVDEDADASNPQETDRPGMWTPLVLSGLLAAAAEVAVWTTGQDRSWLVLALVVASIALGGRTALRKGIGAIRARTLNINLLMSIAVVGAVIIGHWPEAAMVTFLFALAEEIEGRALDRARNAIRGLVALSPDMAMLQSGSGWRQVPTDQVRIDQLIRILPGERAPLDGVVVGGISSMNQAPITGESMPVSKEPGDPVFAGTINTDGSLDIRVTAVAGETTLARIARTIQEAQAQRAPTQRFVDQFARYYTPLVVLAAVLVAVILPLVSDASVYDAVYKALVLLVVACPCALVLSTPVTVVSALSSAARHGILVKGGTYMEQGRKLRAVALDKTGTLTFGSPVVTDVIPLNSRTRRDILHIAASLNVHSTHPVAKAVVAAWQAESEGEGAALLPASEVRALVGRGVTGRLEGQAYFVGSHRLAEELAVCSPEVEALLDGIERAGGTAVVVGSDRHPFGVIGVADGLRPTSRAAVEALLRRHIHVVMLTGDNMTTAQAVANAIGITEIKANLLPEDKLAAIEDLQKQYGAVGMVGDGVNDAPAMARSSIGFAMGAVGTATAVETADVAFMDDDLRKLPLFFDLSRHATAVLAQNIVLSIGIKAAFFVLTLMGVATLWMAVFADVGTSLLVVMNGLRLARR
ncbi:MAG: heavy metal translocating P-type ATPase [Anaerolineae bacterium]